MDVKHRLREQFETNFAEANLLWNYHPSSLLTKREKRIPNDHLKVSMLNTCKIQGGRQKYTDQNQTRCGYILTLKNTCVED